MTHKFLWICGLIVLPAFAQTRPIPPPAGYPAFAGPIYTPIPANPSLDPNSAQIIAGMISQIANGAAGTQLGPIVAAAPPYTGQGYNVDSLRPVYYSLPTDPLYTINCIASGSGASCPLQSVQIHLPNFAVPGQSGRAYGVGPGYTDHYMSVIDSATGVQYDMWQASPPNQRETVYTIGWGSSVSVTGEGLGALNVGRTNFATEAAMLRAPELQTGAIAHALRFSLPCANNYPGDNTRVSGMGAYPSAISTPVSCTGAGFQPYLGARIQFIMAPTQISALRAAPYLKTILTALSIYGAYLTDVGSSSQGAGTLSLIAESGLTYTQAGLDNPWVALANTFGVTSAGSSPNKAYTFSLDLTAAGIPNIAAFLQVIDPCATAHTCTY